MKYLLLILVLALGYVAYTYGPEAMATYHRVRTQVEMAMGRTRANAHLKTGPMVIPGQPEPVVATQNPPFVPPAPAVDLFKGRVAASQRAAVQKYPALSQANSEMNARFVFRYKNLVSDKSARLQDANWPLLLADECAVAVAESKGKSKPISAASRKGTLAAAEATAH